MNILWKSRFYQLLAIALKLLINPLLKLKSTNGGGVLAKNVRVCIIIIIIIFFLLLRIRHQHFRVDLRRRSERRGEDVKARLYLLAVFDELHPLFVSSRVVVFIPLGYSQTNARRVSPNQPPTSEARSFQLIQRYL